MGFFRKLFGGGIEEEPEVAPAVEAPAAPATVVAGDPYRDAGFVSAGIDVEEIVHVGDPDPVWHWRSRVLAIEPNRRGPLPLRWLVYTGLDGGMSVVRRVTFGENGYRIDWEHRTQFPDAIEGYIVRVEDRLFVPLRAGVVAFHILTGKPCWELPHPAALAKEPQRDRDGNLVLVFADQSWMIISPRDGATVREGVARSDRDVEELRDGCVAIGRNHSYGVRYGGISVDVDDNALRARGNASDVDGEPRGPTTGTYPIEGEWEITDWVALAGGKLVTRLGRAWNGKTWAAIGILDPTSLEPLQLLELGEVRGDVRCWPVDELIGLETDLPDSPDDVMFVLDPVAERIVALFREDKADAFLFDKTGAKIWLAPL